MYARAPKRPFLVSASMIMKYSFNTFRPQNNRFRSLDLLIGCTNVRVLDLSGNQVQSFHGVSTLDQIEVLDLSRNLIESLDDNSLKQLANCKRLRSLDLSHNRISLISRLEEGHEQTNEQPIFSELKTLNMDGNPILPTGYGIVQSIFRHLVRLNGEPIKRKISGREITLASGQQ